MCRIRRSTPGLDRCFRPLKPCFQWDHFTSFGLLVLVIAVAWGQRYMANLYCHLDA